MMRTVGAVLAAARGEAPTSLAGLCGAGPILVLTPHPDDETLGCGGLIAAAVEAGIGVHVVLLTDGSGSHAGSAAYPPARIAALRLEELQAALAVLGLPADRLTALAWPDAGAPTEGPAFDRAVAQLAGLVAAIGPSCLFAPWGEDPHCDHVAASRIAEMVVARTGVRLLAYPVWSWMLPKEQVVTALPALRLEIGGQLGRKRAAIACHKSQYGGVILDAREAFTLPAALLDACLTESEIFFDQTAGP